MIRPLFLIAVAACILTALLPAARAPIVDNPQQLGVSVTATHDEFGAFNLVDDTVRAIYVTKAPNGTTGLPYYYVRVVRFGGWEDVYYFNNHVTTDIHVGLVE